MLVVGLACEDHKIYVKKYPNEDDKVRTIHPSELTGGGNAFNSCMVLGYLGSNNVYIMSPMPSKKRSQFLLNKLNENRINTELVIHDEKSDDMTCSFIIISENNGSRTIINQSLYKSLRKQDFMDKMNITQNMVDNSSSVIGILTDLLNIFGAGESNGVNESKLNQFELIHFEGRSIQFLLDILPVIIRNKSDIFITIEIEKERHLLSDNFQSKNMKNNEYVINRLIPFGDILFFSRELAIRRGYTTPHNFIKYIINEYYDKKVNKSKPFIIVLAWGSNGAYLTKCVYTDSNEYIIHHIKGYKQTRVIDTCGAGDTFIAAFLHAFNTSHLNVTINNLISCVDFACKVAGFKVSNKGFKCIENKKFN